MKENRYALSSVKTSKMKENHLIALQGHLRIYKEDDKQY